MQRNGQGLAIPGEFQISIQLADGPTAAPIVIPIPVPGGIHVRSFGGLTKVQQLAATVFHETDPALSDRERANRACDIARLILEASVGGEKTSG